MLETRWGKLLLIHHKSTNPIFIKKIYLNIWPSQKQSPVTKGMFILSEVGKEHLSFFSQKCYLEGESLFLQFLIPKKFTLGGKVLQCRRFNGKRRIIGQREFNFRVHIRFDFTQAQAQTQTQGQIQTQEEQQTQLQNFLKSIELIS